MGREMFHVTIQADGTRILRAICELEDDKLLRDVVATVGADWYPIDAFVRIVTDGAFVGSTWFRFTHRAAECHAVTALEGRWSQAFDLDGPAGELGTHPVHADAWGLAHFPNREPGHEALPPGVRFSTSIQSNGGSGPLLTPSTGRKRRRYVGREKLTVRAGAFDVEHFQDLFPDKPPADLWVTATDYVPVKVQWVYRKQTYELVELSGDAR
ncbi:MAG: hypothetical protein SFV21_11340 [Rhodospirillaceae bacterium]|nr:hypothetical protein [Rhodospirillaceae bacterium]